ncbi:MAG: hypothetical protein GWP62_08900 [Gammaproteobacteria bacterium]|nr:hypothetical protein [Gammaproteobacteria bacterium]
MSRPPIMWSRLFVEGVVIVVSILLAFAIDAWWDERRAAKEAELQVERVVAELEASAILLEEQIKALDVTTDTAKRFLMMFGPEPDPVDKSVAGALFNGLFASGTISFDRSASQRFLASGLLTQGRWLEVRHDLSALLADQYRSEKRSVELREMRPAINAYIARLIPALDVVLGHPLMADYSPSRFPYDPTLLFSDMYFESLIADFAIRMELNRGGHRELLVAHRTLIQRINAARKP